MNNYPPQIGFSRIRPQGFYTRYSEWPIYPNSSNQYWNNDQIVRFQVDLNQKNSVIDPYRSHIQFTVSVTQAMYPVGGVQVDSSAQGFFSQQVSSSNTMQIERITEYDTLAAALTDMGFSEYVCEARSGQGLGYANIPTNAPWTTKNQTVGTQLFAQSQQQSSGAVTVQHNFSGLSNHTHAPVITGVGSSSIINDGNYIQAPAAQWGGSNIDMTPLNPVWNPHIVYNNQQTPDPSMMVQRAITDWGRTYNMRAQYLDKIYERNYPDSTTSYTHVAPKIKNQDWDWQTMKSKGFNPKNPYAIGWNMETTFQVQMGEDARQMTVPTTCNLVGFQKTYCSQFAKGCNQVVLSPTIPQVQMQNGVILPYKVPLTQKTFRVPLLSAVCGILIPPDQFLLIPLASMKNYNLEMTLSRYAMFTTGYNDVHQLDLNGMANPITRQWLLSNFSWNLHMYTFYDQKITEYMKESLTKTINITSYGYSLASSYQITSGQNVKGQYTVAAQYPNLCQIMCIFLSNQYQTKPFCRKQFRLSNNISSMQTRVNTDYYPTQPITGNAGNPESLDSTGDNWNFYQLLLLSQNHLFNTNFPMPRINTKNFAVNRRMYNTGNNWTRYDNQMYQNPNYNFQQNSINSDTALGMSWVHENSCVGRAIFTQTWEAYGHSKELMNGIDTQGSRNLQVIFNTVPTNPFPSDQTLQIFAKYNIIVVFGQQGIQVIGK